MRATAPSGYPSLPELAAPMAPRRAAKLPEAFRPGPGKGDYCDCGEGSVQRCAAVAEQLFSSLLTAVLVPPVLPPLPPVTVLRARYTACAPSVSPHKCVTLLLYSLYSRHQPRQFFAPTLNRLCYCR